MSCVVGIADGKNVWMGCDSAITAGSEKSQVEVDKIIRRGKMLIGWAGGVWAGQRLKFEFKRLPNRKGTPADEYVYHIVKRIKKILNGDALAEVQLLIGFEDWLYTTDSMWAMTPVKPQGDRPDHPLYYSIGIAEDTVMSSFRHIYDEHGLLDPPLIIEMVLKEAECRHEGVRPPYKSKNIVT